MAFAKCPLCGTIFHLRITDGQPLQVTPMPDLPQPALCFDCFPDLLAGDNVELRKEHIDQTMLDTLPDAVGTISKVVSGADGEIYQVQIGHQDYSLCRFQLRKQKLAQ